jgi:hypothetical protein
VPRRETPANDQGLTGACALEPEVEISKNAVKATVLPMAAKPATDFATTAALPKVPTAFTGPEIGAGADDAAPKKPCPPAGGAAKPGEPEVTAAAPATVENTPTANTKTFTDFIHNPAKKLIIMHK